MSPQIVDAVAVFHGKLSACFHRLVFGAQTVLDDEQRLSPALPVVVENDSQADWVDRPTGSICEPHSEDQSPRVGHAVEQGTGARLLRAVFQRVPSPRRRRRMRLPADWRRRRRRRGNETGNNKGRLDSSQIAGFRSRFCGRSVCGHPGLIWLEALIWLGALAPSGSVALPGSLVLSGGFPLRKRPLEARRLQLVPERRGVLAVSCGIRVIPADEVADREVIYRMDPQTVAVVLAPVGMRLVPLETIGDVADEYRLPRMGRVVRFDDLGYLLVALPAQSPDFIADTHRAARAVAQREGIVADERWVGHDRDRGVRAQAALTDCAENAPVLAFDVVKGSPGFGDAVSTFIRLAFRHEARFEKAAKAHVVASDRHDDEVCAARNAVRLRPVDHRTAEHGAFLAHRDLFDSRVRARDVANLDVGAAFAKALHIEVSRAVRASKASSVGIGASADARGV